MDEKDFAARLEASTPRSTRFPDKHRCPRAAETGMEAVSPLHGPATWDASEHCSYCGSLNPDVLMERLEAGTVTLDPTDKNYKTYPHNDGGEPFKQTFRGDGDPGGDDPSKWVWTTRETQETKFYFQHLSEDQRKRFVELVNQKKLKINMPGRFYVPPFFMGVVT